MRPLRLFVVAFLLVSLSACNVRIHDIHVTIINAGKDTKRSVEVSYPKGRGSDASFGVGTLPPQAKFEYRLVPKADGPIRLKWEDGDGRENSAVGPNIRENSSGTLTIYLRDTGAEFAPDLK